MIHHSFCFSIQLLRENGVGIKQIAKEVGVGTGTVCSVI
jgi:hypothetical protein